MLCFWMMTTPARRTQLTHKSTPSKEIRKPGWYMAKPTETQRREILGMRCIHVTAHRVISSGNWCSETLFRAAASYSGGPACQRWAYWTPTFQEWMTGTYGCESQRYIVSSPLKPPSLHGDNRRRYRDKAHQRRPGWFRWQFASFKAVG